MTAPARSRNGHPTGAETERAVLVGVCLAGNHVGAVAAYLDELASLLRSAGGEPVARFLVRRQAPHAATFIGGGKLEELADLVRATAASLVVFDEGLSPSQAHKIEQQVDVRVIDRSALILDIFAHRARTREARTQIELAQLRYLLPRLTRRWTHLSRQAGGIGVRGVGETQLELDRRVVGRRIGRLQAELRRIDRGRSERRKRRTGAFQAALVGYTNAGKTTLLNALTGAGAHTEDRLFATLDPLVRKVAVPGLPPALLIDTVGFVRKLPHDLIASFRSTLQEASAADLLVHVIDLSVDDYEAQAEITRGVLADLGLGDCPVLEAFNKVDRTPPAARERAARLHPEAIFISAVRGDGLAELRGALAVAAREAHGRPAAGAVGEAVPATPPVVDRPCRLDGPPAHPAWTPTRDGGR